jgi:hypothetical protein
MSITSTTSTSKAYPTAWDLFTKLQTGAVVKYDIHLEESEDFGEVRTFGTSEKVGDCNIIGFPARDGTSATFSPVLAAPVSSRLTMTIVGKGTISFVMATTTGSSMAKEHFLTIIGGTGDFEKKRGYGSITFTGATDGTLEFTHFTQ